MTVFATNGFTGRYAVGTAAVVIADTAQEAADYLNAELRSRGLPGDAKPEAMRNMDDSKERVTILNDGNY